MTKSTLFIVFYLSIISLFAQKHDAELIWQETNITINKGERHSTHSYEIKIYNRDGEKYAKVRIPYSKSNRVSNLIAHLKDSNGEIIRKLKKSEITDKSSISSFSLYEDDYVKEFTLKHNSYPYYISYSYEETTALFLHIDYWFPIIDTDIPTKNAVLNVETPLDYKIYFKNYYVNSHKIDTTESSIKHTWEISYQKIIENELFAPHIQKLLPHVVITPQNFNYEVVGSFDSWKDFGNWQYNLLEGLSDLPQKEKDKLLALIEGIDDEKLKIKKLYNYLQDETRYINVSIETGGLKPYPASYVAENKYGDCKALSNYFKAVLELVDIPSYYTKVWAGEPINKIDKEIPSQQFNHIILCVPTKKDTIWLDCTSNGPFDYLGSFTQNRDVFIIDKENSYFTKTPAFEKNDVLESRNVQVYLNEQNEAVAEFQNTYKGEKYENLSYLLHSIGDVEKEQIIHKRFIEKGFSAVDFELIETHRDSLEMKLLYSATSKKVYNFYGDDLLIKTLSFSIPGFEKPKYRKLAVQLDLPIYKTDTLEYQLPPRRLFSGELIKKDITNKYGEYHLEFFQENDKIIVVKSFLLHAANYPIEEYEEFYNFILKIKRIEHNTYIVTTNK